MISCTVSGNLVSDVSVAFEGNDTYGKTFKVRMASNRRIYKDGQYVDEVTWVSGLMSEKRLGKTLPYLVKGKSVICTSSTCGVSSYIDKSGQAKAALELGYIDRIEFAGSGSGKVEAKAKSQSTQKTMEAKSPEELEFPL